MTLTVEEMVLMKSFDYSTKGTALVSLAEGILIAEDPDLKKMCADLRDKIEQMTDEEFSVLDFTVYDEALD